MVVVVVGGGKREGNRNEEKQKQRKKEIEKFFCGIKKSYFAFVLIKYARCARRESVNRN